MTNINIDPTFVALAIAISALSGAVLIGVLFVLHANKPVEKKKDAAMVPGAALVAFSAAVFPLLSLILQFPTNSKPSLLPSPEAMAPVFDLYITRIMIIGFAIIFIIWNLRFKSQRNDDKRRSRFRTAYSLVVFCRHWA